MIWSMIDLFFNLVIPIILLLAMLHVIKVLRKRKPLDHVEKPPVRLGYDNTKLNPWCVEKFDGVTYVRVTGWFAKEENAREVFNRLVKKTSTTSNSSDKDYSTSQDNSTSGNSSSKTYHFYNSQNQNNFNS